MINSKLAFFVDKFWIQDKIRDPKRRATLPLTDVSNLVYWTLAGETTRLFTVEVYTEETEGTPVLIASDDGDGNIIPVSDGILDTETGVFNHIDYETNTVTLTYDPSFLAGLTNPPFLSFKILFEDESFEHHAELRDFLTFALETYKEEELDVYKKYYNPDQIPENLFDSFAAAHGWTIDRFFSESEEYIRLQLKNMYSFYKNKRKKVGIEWAIRLIDKVVYIHNLLARKGTTEQETTDNYNNYLDYSRFKHDELLQEGETDPSAVEAIFDSLFSSVSQWYPTKHFLIDLALNIVNDDGSLLNTIDIPTLRYYTQIIKSKTQYPHYTATLAINAQPSLTEQDGSLFDFYLRPEESQFYINEFEQIYSGPNGVFSIAMDGSGAWAIFPILMNSGYSMNTGLLANMDIDDVGKVDTGLISYFRIGTGAHSVLTNTLTDLANPIESYDSTNFEYRYEGENAYFVCTILPNELVGEEITELGLFNGGDELSFYAKFPKLTKGSIHSITFKIKIDTVQDILPVANLTATVMDENTINLTWINTDPSALNNKIYWSTVEVKPETPNVIIPAGTSYSVGGLSETTTYFFWVEASLGERVSIPKEAEGTTIGKVLWSKLEDIDSIISPEIGPTGTTPVIPTTFVPAKFNNGVQMPLGDHVFSGTYSFKHCAEWGYLKDLVDLTKPFTVSWNTKVVIDRSSGIQYFPVTATTDTLPPLLNFQVRLYLGYLTIYLTTNESGTFSLELNLSSHPEISWNIGDLVYIAVGFDQQTGVHLNINGTDYTSSLTGTYTVPFSFSGVSSSIPFGVGTSPSGDGDIIDNIKVFNYLKTDFSDIEVE